MVNTKMGNTKDVTPGATQGNNPQFHPGADQANLIIDPTVNANSQGDQKIPAKGEADKSGIDLIESEKLQKDGYTVTQIYADPDTGKLVHDLNKPAKK